MADAKKINHYEVLGLPPSGNNTNGTKITQDEIKKAYRSKALQLHPDKRPNDSDANSQFQILQSSYNFLINQPSCESLDDIFSRTTTPHPQQHKHRSDKREEYSYETNVGDVEFEFRTGVRDREIDYALYKKMERKCELERQRMRKRLSDYATEEEEEEVEIKKKKEEKSVEEFLWSVVTKFRYCKEQKQYDPEAKYRKGQIFV